LDHTEYSETNQSQVVALIYAICMKSLKPGIHLNIKIVCSSSSQRTLSYIIKNGS